MCCFLLTSVLGSEARPMVGAMEVSNMHIGLNWKSGLYVVGFVLVVLLVDKKTGFLTKLYDNTLGRVGL